MLVYCGGEHVRLDAAIRGHLALSSLFDPLRCNQLYMCASMRTDEAGSEPLSLLVIRICAGSAASRESQTWLGQSTYRL